MKQTLSILFALAFALSSGLVMNTPVAAATVNVPGDYSTIQAAVDAASPGDTVVVAAGTYAETISIDVPNLTLRSAGGADATIIDAGGAVVAVEVMANLGDVTVEGFTVRNWTGAGIVQRIAQKEGTALHVLNNKVTAPEQTSTPGGNSIQVTGDGSSVIGNEVTVAHQTGPSSACGILVGVGNNVVVRENYVSGAPNGDSGIAVVGADPYGRAGPDNTIVQKNVVEDCRAAIVVQGDASDTLIEGNTTSASSAGIYNGPIGTYQPTGTQVRLNSISHSTDWGVANAADAAVDARQNWWGHASGPSGEGPGAGDAVSEKVLFDPWYADEAMTHLASEREVINVTQGTLHDTIKEAIDQAITGDTIMVTPGVYNERITIPQDKPDLIIQSVDGPSVTIIDGSNLAPGPLVVIGADGTILEGLTVRNAASLVESDDWPGIGILIWGASQCSIINNIARDNEIGMAVVGGIVYPRDEEPVHLAANGNVIAGNEIGVNAWANLVLVNTSGNTLEENEVYGDPREYDLGIVIAGGKGMTGWIIGFGLEGWFFDGTSENNEVLAGSMHQCWAGVLILNASGNIVQDNSIANNDIGIVVVGHEEEEEYLLTGEAIGNTISNNAITGNSLVGIGVGGETCTGTTIDRNTIADNYWAGVGIFESFSWGEYDIKGITEDGAVVINFNNIEGNVQAGVWNETDVVVDATHNWWGHAGGPSGEGPGTGDAVSENVDYSPWLNAPYPGGQPVGLPTVTTLDATDVTADSATLNMDYTLGYCSTVDVIFGYKKSTDEDWDVTALVTRQADGTHSATITGLAPETKYDFLAGVVFDDQGIEGAVLHFATAAPPASGCFVATAAYGTPMAEEIEILREFRDGYLLTNPLGQALTGLYYRTSPPIAEFITAHPGLKPAVRVGLMPAVALSTVVVNTTRPEKAALVGSLVLISVAVAVWATRRSKDTEYA
ncbi:MAG: right-handed parallel beta-helix repeat-containing protein [Dehalococcoidia bacterium]|nr:right-handed parallel beta-helix repeat-containing protein [Dehalococcoidia bacterium]